jgi:Ca2+-binding EF-hand superfamily protein
LKENSPSKPKESYYYSQVEVEDIENKMNDFNNNRRDNKGPTKSNKTTKRNTTTTGSNNNNIRNPPTSNRGFSQLETQELQESFKLFDLNDTGKIQVGNLRGSLEVLQQEQDQQGPSTPTMTTTYPHLNTLLDKLSSFEDNDELTLDEYMDLMASTTISSVLSSNDDGEGNDFIHVFRLFDVDDKGYITIQDLERVALELGEQDMTSIELEEMITRAVQNKNHSSDGSSKSSSKNNNDENDGRVGLEEFTRMMTMNLFSREGADDEDDS